MNRFANINKPLMWLTALLFTAVVAGCGGQDPILGGGGSGANAVAADTTRPRVTVTAPVDGSITAPANTKITATFTENMAAATITGAGTFTLAESGVPGTVTGGPVTYTAGSRTADFKPSADLTVGSTYIATISTAATDLAGNALAGNQAALPAASDYMWIFTAAAADNTPPTITLTTPASGVTGVPLNASVNATFNEAMDASTFNDTTFTVAKSGVPGTIPGSYAYDAPSRIASFTPSSNLDTSAEYVATITTGVTDLSGNALTAGATPNPWVFTTGTGLAPGAVALGTASTFGLMATSAITCVPSCIINGDVSLDPGTSITGPPVINGELHINDSVSAQARNDLLAAYNYAKGLPPGVTTPDGANLGAWTPPGSVLPPGSFPPGTYTNGSTMQVDTPLTLDAQGDANAVWVFQIGSSFTTAADVVLANGAQAKNVFWVPTSDGTIGVSTTFNGTIVAGRDTTAVSGATINGRILTGAITAGTLALQAGTTVNVPAP